MPDLPTGLHVVGAGFLLRAVLRRPLRARAAGGASACSVILAGAAGLAPVPGGASRQDERQGGVHEQLSLPPPSFPPGPGERRGDRVRERAGGLGFDGATELKEATLFVLFCRAGLNLILELISLGLGWSGEGWVPGWADPSSEAISQVESFDQVSPPEKPHMHPADHSSPLNAHPVGIRSRFCTNRVARHVVPSWTLTRQRGRSCGISDNRRGRRCGSKEWIPTPPSFQCFDAGVPKPC